jgi:hypothetical protein
MKGLIATVLCMAFVSVGYAVVEPKQDKEPATPACVKSDTCAPPVVTPEPKDHTKTHHDRGETR